MHLSALPAVIDGLSATDNLAQAHTHVNCHAQRDDQEGDVAAEKHTQLCNAKRRFRERVRQDSVEDGKKSGCGRRPIGEEEG